MTDANIKKATMADANIRKATMADTIIKKATIADANIKKTTMANAIIKNGTTAYANIEKGNDGKCKYTRIYNICSIQIFLYHQLAKRQWQNINNFFGSIKVTKSL